MKTIKFQEIMKLENKKHKQELPIASFEVSKLAYKKGFRDTVGIIRGKSYYNHKG